MRHFSSVAVAILALTFLACSPAAEPAPPAQELPPAQESPPEPAEEAGLFPEPPEPAANEVDVYVVCPSVNANGSAARMAVKPPWKVVSHDPNGTVRWNLQVNGPGTIGNRSLQPKDPATFPWDVASDDDGWTGTPNEQYPSQPPSTDHRYTITIECNGDEIVWDPRMDIDT